MYPGALIQMATGSGRRYTAVSARHRLIRHAKAKVVNSPVASHPSPVSEHMRAGCSPTSCRGRFAEGRKICGCLEQERAGVLGFPVDTIDT